MEQHKAQDPEVMEPKFFIDHSTRVHVNRQRLADIFDAKQHWVFVMTRECVTIVLELAKLHYERCGEHLNLIPVCCLESTPAFFMFPKEHLAFYEIGELLNIEVADIQEQAEKMKYFVLSAQDPKPLDDVLRVWLHQDHLLN